MYIYRITHLCIYVIGTPVKNRSRLFKSSATSRSLISFFHGNVILVVSASNFILSTFIFQSSVPLLKIHSIANNRFLFYFFLFFIFLQKLRYNTQTSLSVMNCRKMNCPLHIFFVISIFERIHFHTIFTLQRICRKNVNLPFCYFDEISLIVKLF